MQVRRFSNSPLRRLAITGVAFLAVLLSCGREVTAPGTGSGVSARHGNFAVNPVFPEILTQTIGAGGSVQFTSVKITIRRADGTVALGKTVDFPTGTDQVPLTLTVPLLSSTTERGEAMTLELSYINAAGETVFKGTQSITVVPTVATDPAPTPVTVPIRYSGTGANAVSVVVTPRALNASSGTAFSFTAQALDASGTAIPGTPIIWSSLNPTIATVSASGAGTAIAVRGATRIVAQLLTGPSDSVTVNVLPVAKSITSVTGSGQSNSAGLPLANPLIVRVTAADGNGVAGIPVIFSVTTGGGSVTSPATTDASGAASAVWTLGPTVGAQSVTASSGALESVTFAANATSPAPTKLVTTASPGSGTTDGTLGNFVVTVLDAANNVATSFTGSVGVALNGGTAGALLSWSTSVSAVAGVATFSGLKINKVGTGYSLTASSKDLASATSGAFDVLPGAASKLAFTSQPIGGLAGTSIGTVSIAVKDNADNVVTSYDKPVSVAIGVNPAAGVLSGTVTANAVAGIATFGNLTINRSGNGYTLVASGNGLVGATSQSFGMTAGAPVALFLLSGGGQTGASATALAEPIGVRVTDVNGNPVGGTSVSFAVTLGGGSVTPTTATTDELGRAQTVWTLGSAGAQSLAVSGSGLKPSPLVVNATATGPLSFTATGGDWNSAASWGGVGIPSDSASVIIPTNVTIYLSRDQTAGDMTINGALRMGSIYKVTTTGNLTIGATGTVVCTAELLYLAGMTKTLAWTNGSSTCGVRITGSYSLPRASSIQLGTVNIVDGSLKVNGGYLMAQSLTTSGTVTGGLLQMTDTADVVSVALTTHIGGARNTTGNMTTGSLYAYGDFIADTNFRASGTHKVFIVNSSAGATQHVQLNHTGSAFFNDLIFQGAGSKLIDGRTNAMNVAGRLVAQLGSGVIGNGTNLGGPNAIWVQGGSVIDSSLTIDRFQFQELHLSNISAIPKALHTRDIYFRDAPYTMTDSLLAYGAVTLTGPLARLTMNGHVLRTASADFSTANGGTLVMQNAGDTLDVVGTSYFAGGSETGLLTDGVIKISNSLRAIGTNPSAFNATGNHQTWVPIDSKASFLYPGSGSSLSHFGKLIVFGGATMRLASDISAEYVEARTGGGIVTFLSSALPTTPRTLSAQALNFPAGNAARMQGVSVRFVDGGSSFTFNGVTFDNFPSAFSGTMLEIARSYTGTYAANNLSFAGTLSASGRYVKTSGNASFSLSNPSPVSASASFLCGCAIFQESTGTGQIVWP